MMRIPTWKVARNYDYVFRKEYSDIWKEYEAHTVDDAVRMFMFDCDVELEIGDYSNYVAQCTNYGDGAILKVEVSAVPQITYEMKVEPL